MRLEPASTALVLVDLQRGVVSRETTPWPAGGVVERAARLADAFRAAGALVVLVHAVAAPDGADALRVTADEPISRPAAARPPDWSELVGQVGPREGDVVVAKRQWGAFYGTDLDLQLRRRGIRTLVVGGIATNFGVESTVRDAFERGYEQILVSDAMAGLRAGDHEFALERIFPRLGRVRDTEAVLAALA